MLGTVCRSNKCATEVEFPSYADAQRTYRKLLHADYEKNCSIETLLPTPEDERAAYKATVLHTCRGDGHL